MPYIWVFLFENRNWGSYWLLIEQNVFLKEYISFGFKHNYSSFLVVYINWSCDEFIDSLAYCFINIARLLIKINLFKKNY